jgi:hypothetical protein
MGTSRIGCASRLSFASPHYRIGRAATTERTVLTKKRIDLPAHLASHFARSRREVARFIYDALARHIDVGPAREKPRPLAVAGTTPRVITWAARECSVTVVLATMLQRGMRSERACGLVDVEEESIVSGLATGATIAATAAR